MKQKVIEYLKEREGKANLYLMSSDLGIRVVELEGLVDGVELIKESISIHLGKRDVIAQDKSVEKVIELEEDLVDDSADCDLDQPTFNLSEVSQQLPLKSRFEVNLPPKPYLEDMCEEEVYLEQVNYFKNLQEFISYADSKINDAQNLMRQVDIDIKRHQTNKKEKEELLEKKREALNILCKVDRRLGVKS